MGEIAREAKLQHLENRLVDGFELIEKRREEGIDVSALEAFWIHLLDQYEELLEREDPAPQIQRIKDIRPKRCSGCNGLILWRFTTAGARMPLDAEITEQEGRGVYVLEGDEYCKPYDPLFYGTTAQRHMNHWTTCPARGRFKNRKRRPMD
jgi:hypothetical protein